MQQSNRVALLVKNVRCLPVAFRRSRAWGRGAEQSAAEPLASGRAAASPRSRGDTGPRGKPGHRRLRAHVHARPLRLRSRLGRRPWETVLGPVCFREPPGRGRPPLASGPSLAFLEVTGSFASCFRASGDTFLMKGACLAYPDASGTGPVAGTHRHPPSRFTELS